MQGQSLSGPEINVGTYKISKEFSVCLNIRITWRIKWIKKILIPRHHVRLLKNLDGGSRHPFLLKLLRDSKVQSRWHQWSCEICVHHRSGKQTVCLKLPQAEEAQPCWEIHRAQELCETEDSWVGLRTARGRPKVWVTVLGDTGHTTSLFSRK